MRTGIAVLLALALVGAGLPGQARAQPEDAPALAGEGGETGDADPKRTVAVLVYRAGVDALPAIDARVAELLRDKTSLSIVDAADARRQRGSRLDDELGRCAGDAVCIARLGRALGAADVVLVGVSQFGDVILTLSRIDVEAREVHGRVAEALAPEIVPDEEALLGYLRRVMPRRDFLRYGVLRIEANIAGATVYVDATEHGSTPIEPLRVPAPERYELQIVKDGFMPFEASTLVPPDSEVVVRANLSRAEELWYKRWWVWTLAGVAVAGTTTAIVLATQRDVPVVVVR
ncbi:PEGA domain-containing protein [Haliangium ochraceum]|uniref:PEGA domain protein n=1 Tax=Haliangium ochraceum (strain DSM 14365 / JCM 11303 / SMP-2) TaxID=502025 RepID=D0LG51_HALO1|nr:PEGA domain-containing protein [Haliangium ochraceum]ACY18076.1 PEGA domain protein [Haliangium ochraceum DSM 14365]